MVSAGELKTALPTEFDSSHASKLDKFKSLKGADFSSRYDREQVSGHKDAVSLFERYAKGGDTQNSRNGLKRCFRPCGIISRWPRTWPRKRPSENTS